LAKRKKVFRRGWSKEDVRTLKTMAAISSSSCSLAALIFSFAFSSPLFLTFHAQLRINFYLKTARRRIPRCPESR
jgi:hypothetical protein